MKNRQLISLTEICEFQGGTQPPKAEFIDSPQDGYVRLLQIRDFSSDKKAVYVPDTIKLRTVESHEILLGRYGGSVGKVLSGKSGAYNVAMMKIIPDETRVTNRFIYYVLNTTQFQSFIKRIGESRVAQDGFNKRDLSRFYFPLPELEEQRRIVGRLNKIQELIDLRVKTTQLLDEHLQSLFLELFLENSSKWKYTSLNESGGIKNRIQGVGKKSNSDGNGKPMIRMGNLSYLGDIRLDDLKWIELSDRETETFYLKDRNVLFNRTNSPDLVGKIAVWDKGNDYTFAGYLIRLELNESILNPYYLAGFFNSNFGKKVLSNKARLSGNLANISGTTFLDQLILMPPIELQKEYERIYLKVQQLKSKYLKQVGIFSTLFQVYLQNAFSEESEINEDEVFEALIQDFTKDDLKIGERLQHLINWINKDKNRFSTFNQYNNAWDKLRELLEDGSIEQVMEKNEIKLKVV